MEWDPWRPNVALIRLGAGVKLLDIQRQAAETRLKELGAEFQNNRWVIPRLVLERFCRREADDLNPEQVVDWRPPQTATRKRKLKFQGRTEFFAEFAKGGFVRSAEGAEILWLAFMKHCLHWLVNEQKPIDMGFCQLCPVPLRANWRAILHQTHRKKRKAPPKNANARLMAFIAPEVVRPQYVAWAKTHWLVWTLEVIPEKPWYRASLEYERDRWPRHKANGREGRIYRYCAMARGSIKRALPFLTRLYATYLSNIQKPGVRLHAVKLVATTNKLSTKVGERRGDTLRFDPPAVVVPRADPWDLAESVSEEGVGDSKEADRPLRAVPDLRPEMADVREPNGAEVQG